MSINNVQVKQLRDFDSFFELVNYFSDEQKCVNYLATLRWNGVIECPYCANEGCYVLNGANKRFKCAKCRKQFSVRVGTIFEDSKIELRKWFFAIYLFTAHKKGISSHQLARDLQITQKTAWFMLQRIREAFSHDEASNLSGEVEIDESYFGGKEINKHKSIREANKKASGSKRTNNKVPLLGILELTGAGRRLIQFAVNLLSGQVTGDSARFTRELIGKILQERSTISTNSRDASTSQSLQLDLALPASKIATLSSGEFVSASLPTALSSRCH